MKKKLKNRHRRWLALAGLLLCLALSGITAFAAADGGGNTGSDYYEKYGERSPGDNAVSEDNTVVKTDDSPAFTSKGNLTLVDDVISPVDGTKEFLTVMSKEGDVFYIIIDRDRDGEGNVYFLNLVDDSDL